MQEITKQELKSLDSFEETLDEISAGPTTDGRIIELLTEQYNLLRDSYTRAETVETESKKAVTKANRRTWAGWIVALVVAIVGLTPDSAREGAWTWLTGLF